jgi:glycosyltransferase involved in cell wall biosynthesis
MKILYVTQVVLSEDSGATRHVLACVRELSALGHEVCLLAPGRVQVDGARHLRPPQRLRPGLKMELALAALASKEMALNRPDVAYVRISASSSAVVAALGFGRIPILLELNGPILDEMNRMGRGPGIVETAKGVLRQVVAQSRGVVVPLPSVGEHAKDALGAQRIFLVENGADLVNATPGDRLQAREALNLPADGRIISAVGNLAPELRLDLLAEAHRKTAGVMLLVVGDGAQRPFIEAMQMTTRPSSPVVFLGRRPHAEAVSAVRAADVCINMRDGCLGTKSLEYAAVGRRQVAFETEGSERIAALYEGLEASHLVKERSGSAVRQAIENALEAEKTLGPLPDEAIQEARNVLGWSQTARTLSNLLDDLA